MDLWYKKWYRKKCCVFLPCREAHDEASDEGHGGGQKRAERVSQRRDHLHRILAKNAYIF
jgi:hypothetical protein